MINTQIKLEGKIPTVQKLLFVDKILKKFKPNFGGFKADLTLKIKVKVTSFRTRPRPFCDQYMV